MQEFWYSVDGDTRYHCRSTFQDWRFRAEDAAKDYHHNHHGWESVWPLDFALFDAEDGPVRARFSVEREARPEFLAWELPLSTDAVESEGR